MADAQTFEVLLNEFDKYLHGNSVGVLKDIFQKIERELHIRRLNVAVGFLVCLILLLLLSDSAHFLCNFIAFVYPACIIIQSIEQGQLQLDNKKWLTYWLIYNAFHSVEYFLNIESSLFRPYWLMKCLILSASFISIPWNGSEMLYNLHIHPFLLENQAAIDAFLFMAWDSINKGVPPFILLFCVYHWGFGFLCHIIGFAYPAYISMVSLITDSEEESRHWMAYWLVYSSITLIENFLRVLPLYYPLKFLVLAAYLLEPLVQKALFIRGRKLILQYKPVNSANRLCHHAVHYFLTFHQNPVNTRANGKTKPLQLGAKVSGTKSTDVNQLELSLQMTSPLVQAVLDMDVNEKLVKRAVKLKLSQDGPGQNFTSTEALLDAVFDLATKGVTNGEEDTDVNNQPYHEGIRDFCDISRASGSGGCAEGSDEMLEENRLLKEQHLCKICMVEEIGVVFVPCGHLMCCYKCAFELDKCPICRADIESSMRTYLS